jgi:hypothetical protein
LKCLSEMSDRFSLNVSLSCSCPNLFSNCTRTSLKVLNSAANYGLSETSFSKLFLSSTVISP